MSKAKLLGAGLLGMLPLAVSAQVTEGPYLDAGTGANFSRDQRVYNSSGQQVGELEYDGGIPGTIAAGYALANGWRGDVEFGFRRNDVGDGSSVANNGSVDVGTMMAMLWFDWPMPWTVRPYAGAGAGQAELDLSGSGGAGTSGSDTVFAWQLSTGLLAQLSPKFALTLGYRLLTTEEARFTGTGLRSEYQSDSAMLGLRYYFKPVKRIRMAEADTGAAGSAAVAAAAPAAEIAAFETVTLRPVNFKFDQAELTEPAQQTLDQIAQALAKTPNLKVVIDGHTDRIGSSEYNMALGERRANAVRDYLASKGVNATLIDVRSQGENQPVEDNTSPDGRAVNRRAEFSMLETPPQNVKIVIEAPTEASKEAAKGPEDPGFGDKTSPQDAQNEASPEDTVQ